MPGTTTTRLALYKPDATGIDNVNVVTDLNNNMDNLDAKVGFVACTSGTRPASPYNGQGIRETDTGKCYIYDGTAWRQILYHTANWDNNIAMGLGGQQLIIGASVGSGANVSIHRSSGTSIAFSTRNTTGPDTFNRWQQDINGRMDWGPGNAAVDAGLYRNSVGELKTDTKFTAVGDITASRLLTGAAAQYSRGSAVVTVANTTTETVLATLTIAANDMIVGATYRITLRCVAGVLTATTPTLTIRSRISGVAGTAIASSGTITASSGVTGKGITVDVYISCVTTGASGTIRGQQLVGQTLSTAGAMPQAPVWVLDGGTTAITVDTTVSRDLVVTAQWSAASTSNTITAYVEAIERVS